MLHNLRNIAVVSLITVGSRLFGLARDILMFAVLGASLWNSAFLLAFTLPNLFRRLLGEGALTSALVPVFSDVNEREGRAGAFVFFNQVLFRLFCALFIIVAVGMGGLRLLSTQAWLPERWALGVELAFWLLPYMLFICLAAVVSAGLNIVGRFAAAASTPILLNLSMIAALSFGLWLREGIPVVVYWLCGGVLLGGLLQLLVPAVDLMRQGWRPKLEVGKNEALGEMWRLFLPGLLGAAILQVNILVSRVLAHTLDESSVSVLYLASRLMELPLGVFTVAVATVFFPLLAKSVAAGDVEGFSKAYLQGMRLIVGISVPAGLGLVVLGGPILDLLFVWGAYQSSDVAVTWPLLAIYGLGLPFYSAATFATRGLHANKDMKTPVRVAGLCLLVNLISGLILMQFYGAAGLAAGNVIAAVVQSALLWSTLARGRVTIGLPAFLGPVAKVIVASLAMSVACWAGSYWVGGWDIGAKLSAALVVLLWVPGGGLIYFALLYFLRFEEMDGLLILARRIAGRKNDPVSLK